MSHENSETSRQHASWSRAFSVLARCAPDRAELLAALRLPGKDYEDAVQVVSAQSAGLDALVTCDPAGYEGLSFAVFSPASFLEVLARSG